jgi:endonuclease YncB( thermonuclease family)
MNESAFNTIKEEFSKYSIDTKKFSLDGLCTQGRIVDIIDGDSLSIILNIFNNYYKFNVRINGIDTCELKSKNELNKQLAHKARTSLLKLITGFEDTPILSKKEVQNILDKEIYIVYLECLDFDKYGRLLANVYTTISGNKNELLSEYLLKNKLAYVYTGETKLSEADQLDIIE